MTRDELDAEFRALLDRHYPGLVVRQRLVEDLLAAASAYTATQIEKHARSPRSQQGPGRQQDETRWSA